MYRVIIVGGGIHGTFFSHILSHHLGVTDQLVVDPYAQPIHVWHRHTAACGMSHLRSPSAHNLEIDYRALRQFAARDGHPAEGSFIPPYARPSLALFDAHCRAVIQHRGLTRFRRQATVEDVRLRDEHVEVVTEAGTLTAQTVVLALGREHALCVPAWAAGLPETRVTHLFSASCPPSGSAVGGGLVIVGAGVSGVQRALVESRFQPVTLITERPIEVRRFDSDPCYVGPRCYERFLAESDYIARRRMIGAARYPGTIPEDLDRPLQLAIEAGRIELVIGRVEAARQGATEAQPGTIQLVLNSGASVNAGRAILATGFGPELPAIVERLGDRFDLPRHVDRFPILDRYLRWHPRLVVTGVPAELELGPSAPNIIGAINAAKRIVPLFDHRSPPADAWSPLVRVLDPAGK